MSQEKTEQPTPRRLRKLREQGDVWQSQEFTAGMTLLAFAIWFGAYGGSVFSDLVIVFKHSFEIAGNCNGNRAACLVSAKTVVEKGLYSLLIPIGLIAVVGLIATYVQVRPVVSLQALVPKLSRLNAISGFKQKFCSPLPYVDVVRNILKLAVVVWIIWSILKSRASELCQMPRTAAVQSAMWTTNTFIECLWALVICQIALSVTDLFLQRWRYYHRNRMSKDEVKREQHEIEGKPEHRNERRRSHREIAEGAMVEESRQADALLVNPTHLAVAIRFDPKRENAPRVIAKGKGHIAARLRMVADQERIPIIHNIPLARAVYSVDLNTMIPVKLYQAIRQVLLWVEESAENRGRRPSWLANDDSSDDATHPADTR